MRKSRGGFLGATTLAGIAGRSALQWVVPKMLNWASKKKSKKSKGKGLYMHGAKPKTRCGKGVALHGGRGVALHGGRGSYLHGGKGIKQVVSKIKNSSLVQGLIKKAKSEAARHAKYAVQNPEKAYQNVKKVIKGEGVKKMKNLTVKQRGLPKQKVGIASNQQGGTTSITMSKHFGTNKTVATPMSIKRIKNNNNV